MITILLVTLAAATLALLFNAGSHSKPYPKNKKWNTVGDKKR